MSYGIDELNKQVKMAAEVERDTEAIKSHHDRSISEIKDRAARLKKNKEDVLANSDIYPAKFVDSIEAAEALQIEKLISVVSTVLGGDYSPIVDMLESAGYTVTPPQ